MNKSGILHLSVLDSGSKNINAKTSLYHLLYCSLSCYYYKDSGNKDLRIKSFKLFLAVVLDSITKEYAKILIEEYPTLDSMRSVIGRYLINQDSVLFPVGMRYRNFIKASAAIYNKCLELIKN